MVSTESVYSDYTCKGVAPYRAGPAMAVPNFKDHTHCTPNELNIEVICNVRVYDTRMQYMYVSTHASESLYINCFNSLNAKCIYACMHSHATI